MYFPFRIPRQFLLILFSALLYASSASAVEMAGVKIDDSMHVANQTLKLNGTGIRYKIFFKVYVASLYLPDNRTTTPEVLALPGAKRLNLVVLRDLGSEELGQRFIDGIKKNLDMAERARLVDSMLAFGQMFAQIPDLKKGDSLNVDWVPGIGAVGQYNGKPLGGAIKDLNFYNALLKIWIGDHAVDEKLKQALLSGKAPATAN
ncbi:MAG: chalcone isomerase family protein [Burkholderiales bacterium]|nr:chalcone isomerase family protein [Burkholderiales bacterium]